MQMAATSVRRTKLAERVYARAAEMERAKREVASKPEPKKQKQVVFVYVNQIPDDIRETFPQERASLQAIMQYVSRRYGVSVLDLKSPRRTRPLVDIRQLGMYVARHSTAHSYPIIGRAFGRRDHTTVLWAVHKVQRRMDEDAAFRAEVESVLDHFAALPQPHCYFGA